MKSKNKLSHQEVMDYLTNCFRELMDTEITNRNMPNIINRGKAASQIVNSIHREELMEIKRDELKQISIDSKKLIKE